MGRGFCGPRNDGLLPEVSLPVLAGEMLADVVRRKGATAGSLDGWGWRAQGFACCLV